ncbi:uncharacterized protein TEOVI_000385800 [Trypanosoma equiperdum]|uniref:Uncharacterized protein n=1 Tax=Trypanosoma equiperdum TaxID=5694 RepID=A0A1G4IIF3_TRYEQ|nr:hypothetical protein, conserved [Trypanosoma equiperdum]
MVGTSMVGAAEGTLLQSNKPLPLPFPKLLFLFHCLCHYRSRLSPHPAVALGVFPLVHPILGPFHPFSSQLDHRSFPFLCYIYQNSKSYQSPSTRQSGYHHAGEQAEKRKRRLTEEQRENKTKTTTIVISGSDRVPPWVVPVRKGQWDLCSLRCAAVVSS